MARGNRAKPFETVRMTMAMVWWRRAAVACVSMGLGLAAVSVARGGWTGFRNGSHDGVTAESVAWPKAGAQKTLWQVPVGEGFGTLAVADGRVFLTASGQGQEGVLALDAATGKAVWNHELGRTIAENSGGFGPR